MSSHLFCRARVRSREFGEVPCGNAAKEDRFGLGLCRVHLKMVDRWAIGHGDEYALAIIWGEWRRHEAAMPRLRRPA